VRASRITTEETILKPEFVEWLRNIVFLLSLITQADSSPHYNWLLAGIPASGAVPQEIYSYDLVTVCEHRIFPCPLWVL
jgi:hypothetical protein